MKVEYDSNNSGGHWWLKDEHWLALEKAGWKVDWYKDQNEEFFKPGKDGRWLGALASAASREGLPLMDAVREWETITGQCSTDAGCSCCGNPHTFTEYDDNGGYVRSGPDASYVASW